MMSDDVDNRKRDGNEVANSSSIALAAAFPETEVHIMPNVIDAFWD